MSDVVSGVGQVQTPARVLDLSARGALMALTGPMDVGAIHDFLLDVGGEGMWVQAEVRRCRKAGGGSYEIGIEFVGIAPRDERRLVEFLGRRVS